MLPGHPSRNGGLLIFYFRAHVKRLQEWGEWMREELLLDVPHRQVVFVIPKMLRIFFKYKRQLLGDLSQRAVQALLKYFQAVSGTELRPGVVASIQTFGQKINLHPHLHCLVSEGGEDGEGTFHHLAEFQDSLLAEFFSREVFALLLGEELISPEIVKKITEVRLIFGAFGASDGFADIPCAPKLSLTSF